MQHRHLGNGRKALQGAGRGIRTEAVVHLDDGDARQAGGGQVQDGTLGLALVAGTHVEHPGIHRLVQHHRAGGRRNQRQLVFAEQGQDGLVVRRAAGQEQGQHALVDELLGIFRGELGIELVVHGDDLDGTPANAAASIDRIQVQLGAIGGFLHAGRHRAREACRLADLDLRPQRRRREQQPHRHGKTAPLLEPHH